MTSELHEETSMLALYRELLALRRHRSSLRAGAQEFLDAPADVLAYLRRDADERSLVLLNFGILPRPVDLTSLLGPESSAVPLLRTRIDGPSGVAERPSQAPAVATVALAPLDGIVLDVMQSAH